LQIYKQVRLVEDIKRIGIICALWIICMFFYHLLIYFTADEVSPGKIDFIQQIISGFILGLLFGLTNGLLEVYVFRQRFKRLKFVYTVIIKTVLFIAAFIATVVVFVLTKNHILVPLEVFEKPVGNELAAFFGSSVFFKHGLYSILFGFGINFFLQIDNRMGKNVLFNLFFGRFHKPRRQKKIIMFLDLKSSTSIAEKIGDYKYSGFLRDFFYDLDEVITNTKGAVYQYVGDEVVVLWDPEDGIENNNCIRFFYESKESIDRKKDKYKELYGVSPQFKAGIHLGDVIVTEVGGLKSEIAYHGDTINTASRLCSDAQNFGNGLLISAELLGFLKYLDEFYRIESAGLVKFKGKEHVIAAFSVYEKNSSII